MLSRTVKAGYGGEVLMDHADPEGPGGCGAVHMAVGTEHRHRAGVGPQEAVGHLHQGALAGTVLTKECVDFPLLEGEVDAAESLDGSEAFGDSPEFEGGRTHIPVGWS